MKRAEEIITLFDKTQQELSSEEQMITGKIFIGGMINKSIITAAALRTSITAEVSVHSPPDGCFKNTLLRLICENDAADALAGCAAVDPNVTATASVTDNNVLIIRFIITCSLFSFPRSEIKCVIVNKCYNSPAICSISVAQFLRFVNDLVPENPVFMPFFSEILCNKKAMCFVTHGF